MRILFLGDVVGKPGCTAVCALLPRLIDRERISFVIANCENASTGGAGIEPARARELLGAGVDVLTSGNHVLKRNEIAAMLGEEPRLLRPANLPPGAPGAGWVVGHTADGTRVAVINMIGRVFMESVDCPFRVAETLLADVRARARVVVVDMHAEATSEKNALGWFLDGKVSAVVGTHTHVQTADERVLPQGTAFVTDTGMCGPVRSVIGLRPETAVRRFVNKLPVRYEVAGGPVLVQGVVIEVDPVKGMALGIERVQERWNR
ncbi:TIGR00282 family metallophosphoesterase [Candidatus Binatia bacterium]|nr:TIGR00282 family metallophosphoesterase [Candidatus Binatia bacterium]